MRSEKYSCAAHFRQIGFLQFLAGYWLAGLEVLQNILNHKLIVCGAYSGTLISKTHFKVFCSTVGKVSIFMIKTITRILINLHKPLFNIEI